MDRAAFTGIQFTGNKGWILGGETYLSQNGGKSWRRAPISVKSEYSIYKVLYRAQCIDQDVSFFSLDGLKKTIDGGRTWTRVGNLCPASIKIPFPGKSS